MTSALGSFLDDETADFRLAGQAAEVLRKRARVKRAVTLACVAALAIAVFLIVQGAGTTLRQVYEKYLGWHTIFNGDNLEGWRNAEDADWQNRWFVERGTLTNEDQANDIATEQQWKDFELRLEYRIGPNGDSGVLLGGRVEIQLCDSHDAQVPQTIDDGAVRGQFPPRANATKPAGEWNRLEVRFVNALLSAKLNGRVIHDQRAISEPTEGALAGGLDQPGPLVLQSGRGKVWFRNIRVRPVGG